MVMLPKLDLPSLEIIVVCLVHSLVVWKAVLPLLFFFHYILGFFCFIWGFY